MKILIVGSQGFIGQHASQFFSAAGHDVWNADVIAEITQKKFIGLNKVGSDFSILFKEHSFDLCINASGNGNVSKSIENPFYDYELNVLNVVKILDSIRLYSPSCRLINFSSAAVYGNPSKLPITERDHKVPISPYGWHKLYAEQICAEYFNLFKIKSVNLRVFSVYGEGLKKQIFWDIAQKIKTSDNNQIELFGTGEETRDFIYIEDLLVALSVIIARHAFDGEVINVASGSETSIKKAATLLCQGLDPSLQIRFNQKIKQGDPLQWKADISTLQNLGFIPATSFENGIKKVAKWIQENI